jgi:hypothetical protein
MIGRPHLNMFAQTRYLIPGVDVRLQLHRSNEKFYMLCDATAAAKEYRFVITQAKLLVKKCTLLPQIQTAHIKHLELGKPACYPMRDVDMKSYTLPQGTVQSNNENILSGMLPDRLIIAMVPTVAVHGSYEHYPYAFEGYGLGSITVSANGDQLYQQVYQVNFDQKRYVEPYYFMFEALGVGPLSEGPNITLEEFRKIKTFFIFNIRDMKEDFCIPRYGNIRVELKFNTPTPFGLTVFVHADYQSVMYIDKHKGISWKDFAPST